MKKIIFTFICLVGIISCKKDSKTTETNNNVITGNISGGTRQINQFGEVLTTGLDDVTITLDNDNVTAKTDEKGNFVLAGVKPGIYTITYSKPGCVPYKYQQINFPGNGTLNQAPADLIETPTFSFQSVTANIEKGSSSYRLKINLKLVPNSRELYAAVITGTTNNLDLSITKEFPRSYKIPANTSDYSFYPSTFINLNDTANLFAKVYASSGLTNLYSDYSNNTIIYLGIGAGLPVTKVK